MFIEYEETYINVDNIPHFSFIRKDNRKAVILLYLKGNRNNHIGEQDYTFEFEDISKAYEFIVKMTG